MFRLFPIILFLEGDLDERNWELCLFIVFINLLSELDICSFFAIPEMKLNKITVN